MPSGNGEIGNRSDRDADVRRFRRVPSELAAAAARHGLKIRACNLPGRKVSVVRDGKIYIDASKVQAVVNSARRGFYSTDNPWHPAYHEIGAHALKVADDKAIWSNYRDIARRVSAYATRGPQAFLAEVFAGVSLGKSYDDEVLQLVDELMGWFMPG